ncbi:MAG: UDP-N-acetylglucosamine 2-epimerase (non-hydrolyzing) [Firmicutes bacterium]|nr:UDP-N-acetylglucosamine 2-epimerase (non-hydrolyzing) [Bacillota bacterium]
MKIVTIVGARPQFIKAAVVSRAIEEYNRDRRGGCMIEEVIVHTGQHFDENMSDIFFQEMSIPRPRYHLGIGGTSHGAMTGRMLERLEEVILREKPDAVMVYGDTNSTLAGALAAVKLHVPVAHVEAGLRSYNMRMPEEVNRILTDRISRWLFCPTAASVENLKNEGFCIQDGKRLFEHQPVVALVGDVMYDAALFYKKIARPSQEIAELIKKFPDGFYLATIHRAENTDESVRLQSILKALEAIAREIPVVLPLHPRTRQCLMVNHNQLEYVHQIAPVGYFDMITLLSHCRGVFTDSGGIQKEAYFFGKPCVTLREETEWVELVEHGFNILAGADYERILAAESRMRDKRIDTLIDLYGSGNAGRKIVQVLLEGVYEHTAY